MKKTTIISCLLLLVQLFATAAEVENKSADEFLDIARNGHTVNTWGIMSGYAEHLRRGESPIESPIRVDIRFTADRAIAKITLNNSENFIIGQPYDTTKASIISNDKSGTGAESLGNIGLRPEDLTMNFLYWKLVKELPCSSAMGFNCRVFELMSPENKEKAIVYIHATHFSTLKAEFIKCGESEPYRTLIADSFEKSDDLWTISSFIITGPGWKTKVVFRSIKLGLVKNGVPKELFSTQ